MIVFENPGEIDIRVITTFGVSVKEGDNPIGFFGTGLKYAVAVLLRAGHKVTIQSGAEWVEFETQKDLIRGKMFEFVAMRVGFGDPTPLGFTTELGKQWQMWMAYREIACNCKDEGGSASRMATMPEPQAGLTRVIVRGDGFAAEHSRRHEFLLEDHPWLTVDDTEVRRRSGGHFFYRGVRVHSFRHHGLFTYNHVGQMKLTEDRTLDGEWRAASAIRSTIMRSNDAEFIRECILAEEDTIEGGMDYHGFGIAPSAAFLNAVGEAMQDRMLKVNKTAAQVWREVTKQKFAPDEITLTKVQLMSLNRALDFCAGIGFHIRDAYPIKFAESLGDGALGLAQDEAIFIAERVFHLGGTKQLAATLIEEYVHLKHGWHDLTRELQNFLFEKMVSLGEELSGEPL